MVNAKLINYDILHDEHDIALLFNSGIDLNGATILAKGNGFFSLIYKDGKHLDLAQCLPELWTRICNSKVIVCSILSADKNTPPKYFEIPVQR